MVGGEGVGSCAYAKGITGQRLARLAGISYRTFLRAQRGGPVKPDVIVSIADALKVPPRASAIAW